MVTLVLLPLVACAVLAVATAILRNRVLSRYAVVAAAVVVLGSGLALVGLVLAVGFAAMAMLVRR